MSSGDGVRYGGRFSRSCSLRPYLVTPSPDRSRRRLGVGLSLCIEAHGGRIWLDAAAPGAAMHFTLPIARTSFPTACPATTDPIQIALVDDAAVLDSLQLYF